MQFAQLEIFEILEIRQCKRFDKYQLCILFELSYIIDLHVLLSTMDLFFLLSHFFGHLYFHTRSDDILGVFETSCLCLH